MPVSDSDSSRSDIRSLIPALHLFRATGLAMEPRKLLLGGLALVMLCAGEWLINQLPFAPPETAGRDWPTWLLAQEQPEVAIEWNPTGMRVSAPSPVEHWLLTGWRVLQAPLRSLYEPGALIFSGGSSWALLAWAWTRLLWAAAVWSLFGGAIARMAAIQFAGRSRMSLRGAVKFSARQFSSFMVAPALPLGGIGCLLAVHALSTWLASLIPSVGIPFIGLLWGIVLFCGFLATLLLLGIVFGWPLMIATISAEDSDGFDGLSRAYGFLVDRPWQALLSVLAAVPAFLAGWLMISLLVVSTVAMSLWLGTSGAGSAATEDIRSAVQLSLLQVIPADAGLGSGSLSDTPDSLAFQATSAWMALPMLLLAGFGPSFFWCAATVTYFVLRHSDDGTPLDRVMDDRQSPTLPPRRTDTEPVEPGSSSDETGSSEANGTAAG